MKNFGMTFGLSIVTIPLLIYYNTTVFGFQSTPSWMNLVIQLLIIINILYNQFIITKSIKAEENIDKTIPKTTNQKILDFFKLSYRNFNIIYFFIIIVIILCVILIPT
jgi:predicted nucleic acid-binding Zn ribbon protein